MSLAGWPCLEETWRAGSSLKRGERITRGQEDVAAVRRGAQVLALQRPQWTSCGQPFPARIIPIAGMGLTLQDSEAGAAVRGQQPAHPGQLLPL